MVAIIHNSSSLRNALHYNENKVRQKVANFIHAGNYPKDTELLSFSDKTNRLENQVKLNQRTRINSVHISLNFDSADKLNVERLKEIADLYMHKIGFGEQPYLVYQHTDAGHPHIHIVTTNIRSDGKRISLHNLARNQSMKASKEIEQAFRLINATSKQSEKHDVKPADILKVQYGKSETKRAITNILNHVIPNYKYTSIAELNAILQQYNIIADQGSKESRIYGKQGLVYRILDANKKKVGVPIKASLIYSKPTLKNIAANFQKNEMERQGYKRHVANAIDFFLAKRKKASLPELMMALQKEKIQVVMRQNDNGIIYGITYVDFSTKCVFNGSDLGKQYSANIIQERCNAQDVTATTSAEILKPKDNVEHSQTLQIQTGVSTVLNDLIQPEENVYASEPLELRKFRKKRKKQQHSHN